MNCSSYWPNQGLGTQYLFNEIKVGSELNFRGAQGVFILPENKDKDIFLICTGTGIAPFRSMINHIFLHQTAFNKIHLVFGCRWKKDLLYYEEMKELETKLPGFHYHPTLSREEWDGHMVMCMPCTRNFAKTSPKRFFSFVDGNI